MTQYQTHMMNMSKVMKESINAYPNEKIIITKAFQSYNKERGVRSAKTFLYSLMQAPFYSICLFGITDLGTRFPD